MEPTDKDRAPRRVALNMKASPELRARVEAAAKESGLSIAQEVERRLLISMADDDRAGGTLQGDLIRGMLLIMNGTTRSLGQDWWEDYDGFAIVYSNILSMLLELQPEKPEAPDPFDEKAMAAYQIEHAAWRKSELYPLRERRNELDERRKNRRGGRLVDADEAEYAEVMRSLRAVVRDGGPKPKLPPQELERWEAQRQREYKVKRARSHAIAASPRFFHDVSEYDDGY